MRDRLFISILLFGFPLCVLAYVPSFIISLVENKYAIALIDTIAQVLIIFLFFSRSLTLRTKKFLFSAVFYSLAIVLFIYLGTRGPSVIILVTISILNTLCQSKKAGLISVASNGVIYIIFLLFSRLKPIDQVSYEMIAVVPWLIIILNLVVFNAVVVLAVSSLVDHLNQSFLKEKMLQEQLKKESSELKAAMLKAEESDRLKTSFINNISHEIRTPLNGILGFGQMLSNQSLSMEEKDRYLSMMKISSNRLTRMIVNFIDISLINSGNQTVLNEEININKLINEVCNQFRDSFFSAGIRVGYEFPKLKRDLILLTDHEMFSKILGHLIDNAIKFSHQGTITVGYKLEKPGIIFYVRDSGIGISEENQERIFERFMQEDYSSTRGYEGSGLGLSIAKGFVELLGGKIWVKSQKGKGSTFFFHLPLVENIVSTQEKVIPKTQENRKLTFLLAEDDDLNYFYMNLLLSNPLIEIIRAVNGREAVEICKNDPAIDLVLMDLKMPDMDGFEATAHIRELRKDLPVIAVTAYSGAEDRHKALAAGCNEFLTKPVDKELLFSKIYQQGIILPS